MSMNDAERNLPPDFDPLVYLELNSDVKAAGVNPADHYLQYGRNEGRSYREIPNHGLRAELVDKGINASSNTHISSTHLENFVWLLNRMPLGSPPKLVFSGGISKPEDDRLISRVIRSYERSYSLHKTSSGMWDEALFKVKEDSHSALLSGDIFSATEVLRNPAERTLFWGFDAIAKSPTGEAEPHELVLSRLNKRMDWQEIYSLWLCDALISFAEIIGAKHADYPEIDIDKTLDARKYQYDVDKIVESIELVLVINLSFPNPFPGELGLKSKYGVIGFRSIQSLYQAWRIFQLSKGVDQFKVLEIGAGLGRTAYFANLFGISNYTIVDIPLTNACQAYFLGRVLGEDSVCLYDEEPDASKIRIIPASEMDDLSERFDLVVNIDSWTEMDQSVATMYWEFSRRFSDRIMSVNHEYNAFTVRDLYRQDEDVSVCRTIYPLRRGYIEELIENPTSMTDSPTIEISEE